MTELKPADRLRIERAVWSLDARLGELPRRSRIAKRRELRANLHAAAAHTGAAEAVRRLGSLRQLAAEYLAAEYGPGALRPAWGTGSAVLFAAVVIAELSVEACKSAFAGGLTAGTRAPGVYTWRGIPYLTDHVTVTLAADHHRTTLGGAWTPLVYLLFLLLFAVGARLWRVLPGFRAAASSAPAEVS